MTKRTTKKTVTFANPFVLGGFDELLPAGSYEVETDEELLESLSFSAYRRILTLIRLPAKSGRSDLTRILEIDPDELDAALERDRAAAANGAGGNTGREAPTTSKARQPDADRQAVERAEGEGMVAHFE